MDVRKQAAEQYRQLLAIESLGDGVTQAFVADFQRRAMAAIKSGGRVKLTKGERQKIVDELADLMLLGFVRRYRQQKASLGIELSFTRQVAKLAKGLDLDLGDIRGRFAVSARKRVDESVTTIEDRINDSLKVITARQQPTRIATRELRRRLDQMGISAGKPAIVETLVRTHAQVAFNAAQWQLDNDDPEGIIWGWQLSVVTDDRTSDVCAAPGVDGFAAPKDDPAWNIWFPPLHWNCRTAAIALFEAPENYGKMPKGTKPAAGFDFNPGRILKAA